MTSEILTDSILQCLRTHIGTLPPHVAATVVRNYPDRWTAYVWFDADIVWRIENVSAESVLDVLDEEREFVSDRINRAWRGTHEVLA